MDDLRTVEFRFQVSDRTLLTVRRRMLVRNYEIEQVAAGGLPIDLPTGCEGLMLRSIEADVAEARVERIFIHGRPAIRYVMQCFPRYYIDMAQNFASYKEKFSGKTLSTIRRKVKKFAERSGGQIRWEIFRRPDELERFWVLARELSARTYQEKLLDSGLPASGSYLDEAKRLAAQDDLRAFLLFDGEKPVSYLFCPVENGVVKYAYLGYDPDYLRFSVGTVLQWLALESLFEEGRFRYFDFTEGEAEHKRLFGTAHLRCANIVFLTPTLRNRSLAWAHFHFQRAITSLGLWLDKHELRTRVRQWMRFGWSRAR